jgi:DNA-binding HxlR family transcriptional regulator
MFGNPLNEHILQVHRGGPLSHRELEQSLGWAPQSSLRAAVTRLSAIGAIRRAETNMGSSASPTELTEAGWELLPIADALRQWLRDSAGDPVTLDDAPAQGILRVLAAGWDSMLIRALAERPLTLVELSAKISDHSYPALKRRLVKLRSTQLVTPVGTGNVTRYAVTGWLARAVVPLALAARWERVHDSQAQPISRVDMEAALLLALQAATLPAQCSGICALAVVTESDRAHETPRIAGVVIEAKKGEIVSRRTGAQVAGSQPTWVLGSIDAWLEALIDGTQQGLRYGGKKSRLATSVVRSLHTTVSPRAPGGQSLFQ